jgi:MFS family permease
MARTVFEIDRSQRHLGPIWLTPGIGPVNVLVLFFSAMMTIVYVTAIGVLLPYLLTGHLGMSTSQQGTFVGNLTVGIEILALLLVLPFGALADKIGRVPVFVGAFTVTCIALILLPLAATPAMLVAGRVLLGIGLAAGTLMLGTIIGDYPQNASRGKLISINGVITGFGVVLIASFGFAQLPKILSQRGYDTVTAGTYTFWLMAALAAVAAVVTWFGLRDGRPDKSVEKDSLFETLKKGVAATRANPRLGIAGVAYFVSRGDLIVMTTFLTLWIVATGTDAGVPIEDAQARGGMLFGISQLAMILFMPVMGFLVDRFDRVSVLAFSMGVAAAGYLALSQAGDPFTSPWIYAVVIAAGAGEACILVSGPALVGQEAPGRVRGAVFGTMGFCGALGVLIHSWMCGQLFNGVSYQTPFLYMAVLNALVGLLAVAVRLRTRHAAAQPAAAE